MLFSVNSTLKPSIKSTRMNILRNRNEGFNLPYLQDSNLRECTFSTLIFLRTCQKMKASGRKPESFCLVISHLIPCSVCISVFLDKTIVTSFRFSIPDIKMFYCWRNIFFQPSVSIRISTDVNLHTSMCCIMFSFQIFYIFNFYDRLFSTVCPPICLQICYIFYVFSMLSGPI